MRVRYTEPAAEELEAIISYFMEAAPSVVSDFTDSIDDAVSQLLDNPIWHKMTIKPGVRRWHLRRFRYSIFFTVERDELVILHIQHVARRWPWEAMGR